MFPFQDWVNDIGDLDRGSRKSLEEGEGEKTERIGHAHSLQSPQVEKVWWGRVKKTDRETRKGG